MIHHIHKTIDGFMSWIIGITAIALPSITKLNTYAQLLSYIFGITLSIYGILYYRKQLKKEKFSSSKKNK